MHFVDRNDSKYTKMHGEGQRNWHITANEGSETWHKGVKYSLLKCSLSSMANSKEKNSGNIISDFSLSSFQ